MKLSIVNQTGQYKNEEIYFGIIGEKSGQWGFIKPNGSWQEAPPRSQKVNVPFFNLASHASLTLSPPIISGRCWLSIGQPLTVPIWDSGFVGPGFNTETDPNYPIIFDKFEFTYESNQTVYCNTTSVDFFGMPITATLTGNQKQSVGMLASRNQIFKAFQEAPPFNSLIRTADNRQLRILAPQKDSTFDPNYLDPYIAKAWRQYQGQSLRLQPLPYNGATYISTGTVDANNVFNFVTTPGNTKHTIQKPTSNNVFGCDGVFNPTGSGLDRIIDGDIKNQVSSALNRAILQNSDSSTWCDSSQYYLNSITNYYANILHELSIDGKSYAFPYDDKCDHSSTLVDTSPTEIMLTLTPFNTDEMKGFWNWTWKDSSAPINSTMSIAFSGWTDPVTALQESDKIKDKLIGETYISFGGGNENGHFNSSSLDKIITAINDGKFSGYDGISFDVEEGEQGLANKFKQAFATAKNNNFKVLVTVSHSAPYGIPDAKELMDAFFADSNIDYLSPQLYTTGTETENDFTEDPAVTWKDYLRAKAAIIPSIVQSEMYQNAKDFFNEQGINLQGFIQWSQVNSLGSTRIALHAHNQKYVSADLNRGGNLVADRNQIDAWETFELINVDNKVAFLAANGKYVSADLNQGGILIADRDQINAWETFELINVDNKIAFLAANGKYVAADLNQGGILVADRNQIDDWETFELIKR